MLGQSVVRMMIKPDVNEPNKTIIIRRCIMNDELENDFTEEELEQFIKDMEDSSEEELEGIGDEEMDDEEMDEVDDDEMMDDTEDEYL